MRFLILALLVGTLFVLAGCPSGVGDGSGNNDILCTNAEQNRCFDAGCTDGDDSESPNPSAASCGGECREYYCDGYCECEVWIFNEECSECM